MKCFTIYNKDGDITSHLWISKGARQPHNSVIGEYDSKLYKIDVITKQAILKEEKVDGESSD